MATGLGIQLVEMPYMPLKPRRTVLIVEDALTVRNMLEDFFTMYGYDVLMASDPDSAFKRLKESHAVLDALVLDIALDDNRSGLEVLELMRLDDRFVNLTVVVLTGLPNLDDRDIEIRRHDSDGEPSGVSARIRSKRKSFQCSCSPEALAPST